MPGQLLVPDRPHRPNDRPHRQAHALREQHLSSHRRMGQGVESSIQQPLTMGSQVRAIGASPDPADRGAELMKHGLDIPGGMLLVGAQQGRIPHGLTNGLGLPTVTCDNVIRGLDKGNEH
jgi:hypothetical protein